ncbi:nucleotidyltransferase family protein [Subtercola sp. PAMC28395]|uniref:nucleotidyltransferase family protein n=1 Tax=Subtercola sp. PAMC28395 TaxID=2846775 RepID=UPI00352D615C
MLRRGEAVLLAHALVANVAESTGVRYLFVKGPTLNEMDLRPARSSSDVDVLVDPRNRDQLVASLKSLGWSERDTDHVARILPMHAVHLIHENWPCDIDVHFQFPGCFGEDLAVFNELWRLRTSVQIAGRRVSAPNRVGSALIASLHALRDPRVDRNSRELEYLEEKVRSDFTIAEIDAILVLATNLRSLESSAPFLRKIGLGARIKQDLNASERRLWAMRISDDSRSLGWLLQIRNAPWNRKLRVSINALNPPSDVLRREHPESVARSMLSLRMNRLLHGIRALPKALVAYWIYMREAHRRLDGDR